MTGVFKRVDLNTVCALKFVVGRTEKVQGKVRAEVKFPLILIHTPYGLSFFDKICSYLTS